MFESKITVLEKGLDFVNILRKLNELELRRDFQESLSDAWESNRIDWKIKWNELKIELIEKKKWKMF